LARRIGDKLKMNEILFSMIGASPIRTGAGAEIGFLAPPWH